MSDIKFTIDGKECAGKAGQMLADAAADNGIYIPTLCHLRDQIPAGSCRICTVKVNGKTCASCTTPIVDGMSVENNTPEINDIRTAILELLFTEGNHFCPSCEKSGRCELQAMAYKYQMLVPRFKYRFPRRPLDASSPYLIIDNNRCIQCKKCVRMIKDPQGRNIFNIINRGGKANIAMDPELAKSITEELAQKAMDICPVGAILKKEVGFNEPLGERKYDKTPIGSDIEKA